MLSFIAAVYNEEKEILDLISHVEDVVDWIYIVDDGSTDNTVNFLQTVWLGNDKFGYVSIPHTGLPETVKSEALKEVPAGSWVLMLDADERLAPETLREVVAFTKSKECRTLDYVYFTQLEIIDGKHVRTFQKCKLFRKEAITFPLNNIHADDVFMGNGTYKQDWLVYHRKTSDKQKVREHEYLATYKKLLDDGKIDEGRYEWLKNLHHFVR